MKKIIFPVIISSIVVFAACAPKSTPTTTVAKITYDANVQQLIQAKCTPCHLPSKGGFKTSFESFSAAQKYGTYMLGRVELVPGVRGFMPMKGERLSEAEINIFKDWVKDGLLEK